MDNSAFENNDTGCKKGCRLTNFFLLIALYVDRGCGRWAAIFCLWNIKLYRIM